MVAVFKLHAKGSGHAPVWIRPISAWSQEKQTQILKLGGDEKTYGLPVIGGTWNAAVIERCKVKKSPCRILLTTAFLCWVSDGNAEQMPLSLLQDAQADDRSGRHFSTRGFYGVRFLKLDFLDPKTVLEGETHLVTKRCPIMGGLAAGGMLGVLIALARGSI